MRKLRHILLAIISIGSMLCLSGCNLVILNPKGIIGIEEKHLLITAVILMAIIVIPVFVLTAIIARKYRESNKKSKYTPNWSHSNLLEGIWWSLPLIIIVILAVITWVSTHRLNPYNPLTEKALGIKIKNKPIQIQAVALRWKWLFIYPKQEIATVNTIAFPVDTPVEFVITSDAPMNSFMIPQLGGQIYAMNGMTTKLNLMANTKGNFWGRSVSFSGAGFAGMKFMAHVMSKEDFHKWVESARRSSKHLSMSVYDQLVKPSKNNKPEYFSSVKSDMFKHIIAKFMTPNRHKVKTQSIGVGL